MTNVFLPVSELVPMLSFLAPKWLWLLSFVPVLVAVYLLLLRRKAIRNKQFGRTMLDFVIPKEANWRRHVAVAFSILSLISLTVAIAKPKDTVEVPRERATIVVTIDVSNSMAATDVEPNRLQAAKTAAQAFVNSLPVKYNVSIVEFAAAATVLLPPSLDRGAATAAIASMQLEPSTAIGEGIYTSLAALAQAPPDPGNPTSRPPGRVVLLSDGKTQVGRSASDAATEAKKEGVPVYTIAYGTENGYIEIQGTRQPVPVDREELANVAKISGGKAYTAQSAGQLKEVYNDIGSSVGKDKVDKEVSSRYAGFGLAFALLAALGLISLGARWP